MNTKKEIFEKMINKLGVPAFRTGKTAIYNIDCMEGMTQLNSGEIDLTVTSPPYNIGKEYEKILDIEHYIDWCELWMSEIYRVTQEKGSFWLNLGHLSLPRKAKALPLPYLLWDKNEFYFIQELVWNYGAGVAGRKYLSPRNEKFLWYVKDSSDYVFNLDEIRDPNVKYPNQKKNGVLRCNPLGKNPSDVWQIAKVTSGRNRSAKERTSHPAQFPTELIDRIIKASSNAGDIIMDPFMGSGTTAVVASKNDRYSIGFEINKDYISIIKNRFNDLFL